jgi:hypothetical protein
MTKILINLSCGHARLTFGCDACRTYATGQPHVVGSKAQVEAVVATVAELQRRVAVLCQAAEAVWAVASVPRVVDRWKNLDRMVASLVERCDRLKARVDQAKVPRARV